MSGFSAGGAFLPSEHPAVSGDTCGCQAILTEAGAKAFSDQTADSHAGPSTVDRTASYNNNLSKIATMLRLRNPGLGLRSGFINM